MNSFEIDAVVAQRRLCGWCVLVALLCSCSGVTPVPDSPPDSSSTAIATEWLLRDCTFGSQGELAKAIRDKGGTLYATFEKAYTKGPDSLTIAGWREGAERHYDAVQTLFATTDTVRIPPRARQPFLSTTKQDYSLRVVAQCVTSWRSNALVGVGLTRAANALLFINAVAADPKSDSTIRRTAALAARIYADTSGLLIR